MSGDRETTRLVRAWLQTDEHESADRVLDAVLEQIDVLPQRRAWWSSALFDRVGVPRVVLAATAMLLIAIVGLQLVGGRNVGDAKPTPAPSALSLVRAPVLLPAGTYEIDEPFPVHLEFSVPDGWSSYGVRERAAGVYRGSDYDLGFSAWIVDNLPVDGCDPGLGELDPPVGPTVDDLAAALASRPGYVVEGPVPVTLDGYEGMYLELTGEGIPGGGCFNRRMWAIPSSPAPEQHISTRDQVDRIWILDVDGTRVVIDAFWLPTVNASERAELDAVIASLEIGAD